MDLSLWCNWARFTIKGAESENVDLAKEERESERNRTKEIVKRTNTDGGEEVRWNNGNHCPSTLPRSTATQSRSDKIGRVSVSLIATIHRRHRVHRHLSLPFSWRGVLEPLCYLSCRRYPKGQQNPDGSLCSAKETSHVRGVKSTSRGWHEARCLSVPPENRWLRDLSGWQGQTGELRSKIADGVSKQDEQYIDTKKSRYEQSDK